MLIIQQLVTTSGKSDVYDKPPNPYNPYVWLDQALRRVAGCRPFIDVAAWID